MLVEAVVVDWVSVCDSVWFVPVSTRVEVVALVWVEANRPVISFAVEIAVLAA